MNRNRNFPTRTLIAACATAAALAAPAVASATDRWVDTDTGTDGGNSCTVQATPCKTINHATTSSQMAGDAGTIHVDQGTYAEQVSNLAQTNHLMADDFVAGDSGATTIDGGNGIALAVQVNASASGFEIRSNTIGSVVFATDNATVYGNTITAKGANSKAVEVFPSSGTTTVRENTILADSGDEDYGIVVDQNVANAVIRDNEIGESRDGFAFGVTVKAGSKALVDGNTILGSRKDGGIQGKGIEIDGADQVTVSDNLVTEPMLGAGNESYGIDIENLSETDTVALERNQVLAMSGIGLTVSDAAGTITSAGDIVAGNSDRAMYIGGADVTLTNDTVVGIQPVQVNTATLTVDSSILDVPISSSGGAVSCEITYSRGPAIVEGGNGCGEFQTTADPQFVATNVLDYHLKPSSPLIDMGNPAAPAPGAVDIDGDARALEGDGACPRDSRRDMGADEVVATFADCPVVVPPPAKDETAPESGIVGKRKQFGTKARFTLTSTEEGSSFECRLDRGKFAPCKANYRSRNLNLGRHTLFVRATDAAGNTDATPVAKKFKLRAA